MTGEVDWVFWTLGGLLGLVGLALAWWALFADRAEGRKRCPKCWYDMTGSPGLTCSECGYSTKRDKKLLKTRRHWRTAAVAVLVLLGSAASGLLPKVRCDGWTSIVPTTVLILVATQDDESTWSRYVVRGAPEVSQSLTFELLERVAEQRLWRWQWRLLVDRWLFDDSPHRHTRNLWDSKYRLLLAAVIRFEEIVADEGLRAQLAEAYPLEVSVMSSGMVSPTGAVRCVMQMKPSWGYAVVYHASLTARQGAQGTLSATWDSARSGNIRRTGRDGQLVQVDAAEEAIVFEVEIKCRAIGGGNEWHHYSSDRLSIPIRAFTSSRRPAGATGLKTN